MKDVFTSPDTFGVICVVVLLFLLAVLVFLDSILWIFAAAWTEPQMQDQTTLVQQAIEVLQAARNH